MKKAITTKRFKKDIQLVKKRGKKLEKLKLIMELLLNNEVLPIKYSDHLLKGNFVGRRECHIEPNWLLIYKSTLDEIVFERTGTHSDLFE